MVRKEIAKQSKQHTQNTVFLLTTRHSYLARNISRKLFDGFTCTFRSERLSGYVHIVACTGYAIDYFTNMHGHVSTNSE